MKAWYGAAATKENDFAYEWLPKIDGPYDVLRVMELMSQGKVNGYVCQGFNPLSSFPDKAKILGRPAASSSTSSPSTRSPPRPPSSGRTTGSSTTSTRRRSRPRCSASPPPCFAEEDGSLVSSARWLQWHWKAAEPPVEAKGDLEIVGELFLALKKLYAKEGGAFPEPVLKLTWPYRIAKVAGAPTRWPGSSTARRSPTSRIPRPRARSW